MSWCQVVRRHRYLRPYDEQLTLVYNKIFTGDVNFESITVCILSNKTLFFVESFNFTRTLE